MTAPIWAFVVGTYRTGSTTQNRIAAAVVEHAKRGKGIGYHQERRLVLHDTDQDEYIVCKVFRYLPDESKTATTFLEEERIRVIGTVRDPRDIFVSMQERARRSGRIDDFSGKRVIEHDLPMWLGWFNKWATKLPKEKVYVSKFEEMILNLGAEAQGIASFLGINISRKEAQHLTNPFKVPAQKKAKEKYWKDRRRIERGGGVAPREHPVLPSIPGVEFGTAGHWPIWLNPVQVKGIQESCKEYMTRWGYS